MNIQNLLNLDKEEFEKELKKNSYNDLLDICNNLAFDTIVSANSFGAVYISYNTCIELLTDYFISYSNHEDCTKIENVLNIENLEAEEIVSNNKSQRIKINLIQVIDDAKYFLCGNNEALGSWDTEEAKELELKGNILSYEFYSDNLENIEYKLFKKHYDGTVVWENGDNRIVENEENYIAWR